jgi:hypothetical protein
MSSPHTPPPEGFGPILRSSPVLEALGGFMSRGEGAAWRSGFGSGRTPSMPGAACVGSRRR